jgi:acetoin utilization protein AcuB
MRIRDFMTRSVETTAANAPAQAAWEQMRRRRIRHLVVMQRGAVRGVVSERDLGGADGEPVRRDARVEDLMTTTTLTIRPDATALQAANLMRGRAIGCLPVLDREKLVGIVTAADLLALVGRGRAPARTTTQRAVLPRRRPRAPRSLR